MVFDEYGRPALVNDHAKGLLGDEIPPPGELKDDVPMIAGDRVLLASSRAVERDGRRVGTVMTLRDRTEVETLARELGATKALADALRAQTHEAANRLHVIAGLVELGRAEEAIELAGSEAANAQDLLGRLGEGIEEPVLVALLLGKTATARERGVTLTVAPGARLCAGFPPTELATIVGNLVDNALEALGPDREGSVTRHAHRRRRARHDRGPRRRPRPPGRRHLRAGRDDEARGPGRTRPRPRARQARGDRARRHGGGAQRRRRGVHGAPAARGPRDAGLRRAGRERGGRR